VPEFHTLYTITDEAQQDHVYGSSIFAKDLGEAEVFAEKRGKKEKIVDLRNTARAVLCSERIAEAITLGESSKRVNTSFDDYQNELLIAKRAWVEAAHAGCWLADFALSSGFTVPDELLSDRGLVHELNHVVAFGSPTMTEQELLELARRIEAKTPGMTRC